MLCACLERLSPTATTPETRARALPQVPEPDSEASRPRIPVGRPRLPLPQFDLPRTSGDDDGLLVYLLWFNGVVGTKKSHVIYEQSLFFSFLRASAMLKHVIDIGWTSVCPSVCHTLAPYQNG